MFTENGPAIDDPQIEASNNELMSLESENAEASGVTPEEKARTQEEIIEFKIGLQREEEIRTEGLAQQRERLMAMTDTSPVEHVASDPETTAEAESESTDKTALILPDAPQNADLERSQIFHIITPVILKTISGNESSPYERRIAQLNIQKEAAKSELTRTNWFSVRRRYVLMQNIFIISHEISRLQLNETMSKDSSKSVAKESARK